MVFQKDEKKEAVVAKTVPKRTFSLDDFTVEAFLGKGAFCSVYLVRPMTEEEPETLLDGN